MGNFMPAEPEPKKYLTYWATRERKGGKLSDKIEIWLVRPERIRFTDGDVMWLAPADAIGLRDTFYGEWSVDEALKNIGPGYPATDRECVVVGNPEDNPIS